MASPIFDVNAMDRVPSLSSPANMTADVAGTRRNVRGVDTQFQYTVTCPEKQVDGTTATSGTLDVTITFYDALSGGNAKGTITTPQITLGTSQVRTLRGAVPEGAIAFAATLDLSVGGNAGNVAAGVSRGGTRINRAG